MQLDLPNEQQDWIDTDRAEVIKFAKEAFPDNWEERFQPGSHGFFALLDRVQIAYENWESYVSSYPAAALDAEVYDRVHKIGAAMADFYQILGRIEWEAMEKENE